MREIIFTEARKQTVEDAREVAKNPEAFDNLPKDRQVRLSRHLYGRSDDAKKDIKVSKKAEELAKKLEDNPPSLRASYEEVNDWQEKIDKANDVATDRHPSNNADRWSSEKTKERAAKYYGGKK